MRPAGDTLAAWSFPSWPCSLTSSCAMFACLGGLPLLTLLGAPGIATRRFCTIEYLRSPSLPASLARRKRTLLGAPHIATRSKDATYATRTVECFPLLEQSSSVKHAKHFGRGPILVRDIAQTTKVVQGVGAALPRCRWLARGQELAEKRCSCASERHTERDAHTDIDTHTHRDPHTA